MATGLVCRMELVSEGRPMIELAGEIDLATAPRLEDVLLDAIERFSADRDRRSGQCAVHGLGWLERAGDSPATRHRRVRRVFLSVGSTLAGGA